jgi:serine/threonine-protein kinase
VPPPTWAAPTRYGAFEVVRLLGEGGTAQVLLGWDPEGCRQVAIKVSSVRPSSKESTDCSLLAEADILEHLRFPGVPLVLHRGRTRSGVAYLVLPLIIGDLLRYRINRLHEVRCAGSKRELLGQMLLTFADLCAILHRVHGAGFVHRDIKPTNVLVRASGRVELIDFGIGRPIEPDSPDCGWFNRPGRPRLRPQQPFAQGTPGYMSPEQIEGSTSSARPATDVFGLGVVLYELLVGRRPFQSRPVTACFAGTLRGLNEGALKSLRSSCTVNPLVELCIQALAVEPGDRPASAAIVGAAVRGTLQEHWPALEPFQQTDESTSAEPEVA